MTIDGFFTDILPRASALARGNLSWTFSKPQSLGSSAPMLDICETPHNASNRTAIESRSTRIDKAKTPTQWILDDSSCPENAPRPPHPCHIIFSIASKPRTPLRLLITSQNLTNPHKLPTSWSRFQYTCHPYPTVLLPLPHTWSPAPISLSRHACIGSAIARRHPAMLTSEIERCGYGYWRGWVEAMAKREEGVPDGGRRVGTSGRRRRSGGDEVHDWRGGLVERSYGVSWEVSRCWWVREIDVLLLRLQGREVDVAEISRNVVIVKYSRT